MFYAVRIHRELKRVRALGAQRSTVDRALGIALNINDPSALQIHELAAAYRAVRAHAVNLSRVFDPRVLVDRIDAEGLVLCSAFRIAGGNAHIRGHQAPPGFEENRSKLTNDLSANLLCHSL
jgi:hypothetical protein